MRCEAQPKCSRSAADACVTVLIRYMSWTAVLSIGLRVCRRQARVGRARPRASQNPAERLGDDDDDMDVDNADVAGPSGLHSESLTAQKMSQFSAFNTEMVLPYVTQGAKTAETCPSYTWNQERC